MNRLRFLALALCLAVLVLPLAACSSGGPTGDPYIKVRSPLWAGADPVLNPSGYAMPVSQQPAYVSVPQYAVQPTYGACAPAASAPAAAPAYTPGYQYAAPPVPAAAAGCR